MDTKYTQCQLEKGNKTEISWIPAKFAQPGKYIKLKADNGWDDGWKVVETYATMDEESLRLKERDYRNQRDASDI